MNLLKKKISLLIASSSVVLLSGCALIDAYFMAGYDNNEYSIITLVRTASDIGLEKCNDRTAAEQLFIHMHYKSLEFKNYTQYIPDNEEAFKLASGIIEIAKQAKEKYETSDIVSEAYCKLKMQQINRSAEKIQKVIGSKPR